MGPEQAFIQAYDQYADAIYRHCYFRVLDREKARDLMQEAFTRTWSYLADGNEVDNLRAFLYRVANNLIIDQSRKRPTVSLDEIRERGVELGKTSPEDIGKRLDLQVVAKALQQIDPPCRDLLILRYLDGMPPRDIAKTCHLPISRVYVQLHRGRQQLRILLSTTYHA
ncbi:MAG: RNA polymerase sigma-70 factor, ECF subfamily [Parcubacteria group bacterium Gr01-1014_31]|nr:MAG: RNA polymerase sigma-70 factor, ECF subfamily [Parcubacteria group bacterium Gr01-1014_31]